MGSGVGVVARVGAEGAADEGVPLGGVEAEVVRPASEGSDLIGDEAADDGLSPRSILACVVPSGCEGGRDELVFLPSRSLEVAGCDGSHNVSRSDLIRSEPVASLASAEQSPDDVGVVFLSSSRC